MNGYSQQKCALLDQGWKEHEALMYLGSRRGACIARCCESLTVRYAASDDRFQPILLPQLTAMRRSIRDMTGDPIPVNALIKLLDASVTSPCGRPGFAVPGGIAALSIHVLVKLVIDDAENALPIGSYNFGADRALHGIRSLSSQEVSHCVDASDIRGAAAIIVVSTNLEPRQHYINRYELSLLEIGQVLQNIAFAGAEMGLATCILGSVFYAPLTQTFGWDGPEKDHGARAPIVAVAVGGRPAGMEEKL
jgi:nitroreductase family protein